MTKCVKCGAGNTADAKFCGECGKLIERLGEMLQDDDFASDQTIGMFETIGRRNQVNDKQLEFAEGDVFAGRYTIVSLLGRGGMGVVYKAIDRHGERDVALKLIRPDLLAGAAAIKRLITEGVTTQELTHPNIVRVYNVDEVDHIPYVAMEHVGGETLAEWLRARMASREQVPTRVAARIVMEIMKGLEAAHDAGIIHRDLKPQNIILTEEPSEKAAPLKILDFGIARAANREETLTGSPLGTPGYMAPEQRTDPDLADSSADLFSLSKIFYKMLMDALPDAMWQPPSASRQDVPAGIDALIWAGISVNRKDRPHTVADYRSLLLDAMNSGGQHQQLNIGGGGSISHEPEKNELQKFAEGPVAKPLGFGCLGLIALVALIGMLGQCSGPNINGNGNGQTLVSTSGGGFDDKPPPPPPANYTTYSGTWTSHRTGQALSSTVYPDGSYEIGGVVLRDWGSIVMTGGFFGSRAEIIIETTNGTANVSYFLTDPIHVLETVSLPDGSTITDCYHVNHAPTQTCP